MLIVFLASRTATGAASAVCWAMNNASECSSSEGTTLLTSPISLASSAGICRPVRMISFARPIPTSRGNR